MNVVHPLKRDLMTGKNRKKERKKLTEKNWREELRSSMNSVWFNNIIIDDKA